MLELEDIHHAYGKVTALRGVSLRLEAGEVVGVSGRNGAGKSSLIRVVAGLLRPTSGRVTWQGKDVTRVPFHAREGIALVPEGRILAPSLTVEETLRLGAPRTPRGDENERRAGIFALFPVLAERLDQKAGTLSGGEAQMLAIGRALMSGPQLLLLDEPTLGLSPSAATDMFRAIGRLGNDGMTILITDQNANAVSKLAARTVFLTDGQIARTEASHLSLKEIPT